LQEATAHRLEATPIGKQTHNNDKMRIVQYDMLYGVGFIVTIQCNAFEMR